MRNENGTFGKGNTFGKGRTGVNKLTAIVNDLIGNHGYTAGSALLSVASDEDQSPELRAKADGKLLDYISKIPPEPVGHEKLSIDEINKQLVEAIAMLETSGDFIRIPKEWLKYIPSELLNNGQEDESHTI
ncbi:hypothetical protein [Vibrio rotiferianus]|uniref:hypothetical protein n=1 Tax=Vibrio rotiferianus TaxID=190895 RepID=UPI00023771E4|nr:hypothetical protein [Vibrio rotiferianus]